MHHNSNGNNGYWLDSLFNLFQQNDTITKSSRSLESQFNILSKLIILSFFIFTTIYSIKTSLSITLTLLFIVSVLYYVIEVIFEKRENFDEEEEIYQQKPSRNRTNVRNLNLTYETTNNRDIYLERRPSNIKYKEILPLDQFYDRTTSSYQNPNLVKRFHLLTKYMDLKHGKNYLHLF